MAPNGARRIFVPTNPDLADILGRTDVDFVVEFLKSLENFGTWTSRNLGSKETTKHI